YRVAEHWSFLRREVATPHGLSGKFIQVRVIGSGEGVVRFFETTSPLPPFPDYLRWGYGRGMVRGFHSNMYGVPLVGEKYLRLPGLEIHTVPAQMLPAIPAAKTGTADSMRTITIAWWIVVIGCAILPLMWAWGATMW